MIALVKASPAVYGLQGEKTHLRQRLIERLYDSEVMPEMERDVIWIA